MKRTLQIVLSLADDFERSVDVVAAHELTLCLTSARSRSSRDVSASSSSTAGSSTTGPAAAPSDGFVTGEPPARGSAAVPGQEFGDT